MLGIDPGLGSSIAVLDAIGAVLALSDAPILMIRAQRGTRHTYAVSGRTGLVRPYTGLHSHVMIEESQAMPGQGTRSTFTTGYGMGIWIGLLATLKILYTTVRSQVWKRVLRLSRDKEASRLRAIQLFPGAELRRKKDHGRAEALLLAYYGWQKFHQHFALEGGALGF